MVAAAPAPAPKGAQREQKPRRIWMEGLQRAMSDLALEISRDRKAAGDARTPDYMRRIREQYCGRWVCGLCAATVDGEAKARHAGRTEEALAPRRPPLVARPRSLRPL